MVTTRVTATAGISTSPCGDAIATAGIRCSSPARTGTSGTTGTRQLASGGTVGVLAMGVLTAAAVLSAGGGSETTSATSDICAVLSGARLLRTRCDTAVT